MRLFTVRGPSVLTGSQMQAFGIQSHPAAYRSPRFERWLGHCKAGDADALRSEMLDFLYSREAIKTYDDLGDGWSGLVDSFLIQGPEIERESAFRILKESRLEALFSREGA